VIRVIKYSGEAFDTENPVSISTAIGIPLSSVVTQDNKRQKIATIYIEEGTAQNETDLDGLMVTTNGLTKL